MNKIKIATVFGTRPEATKMAPLVKLFALDPRIRSLVCVTGQHRQMLDQVLNKLDILPDHDLNIMRHSQTLEYVTSRVLEGLSAVLAEEKPDLVLVHGDTTTAFAGCLAAFYNKIPVGHVEAGLRTFDKYFPFPEEMNRKLVDAMADLYFCPTSGNRDNLLREGVPADRIWVTGNTAIDFLRYTAKDPYVFQCGPLNNEDYSGKRVLAVEIHRREILGQPIRHILKALRKIAEEYSDVRIIWPVHLHPEVKTPAREILGDVPNVLLLEPVDVFDMHNLLRRSYLVFTDSGGLQEEAPSLGAPVLVARRETERQEAVDAGTVRLAGTEYNGVYDSLKCLLDSPDEHAAMVRSANPYGDGRAAEKIRDAVFKYFGIVPE
ncbi:MAG TPA: UDP-N-acetylglucosamine 2-epimerase (non-hydrolyzing) [Clostridiales bacterium]|nr:UDP-N-acetylglucosamine 2-epimerase (non-hydrolyzing) [Clostridiales bacterium]